MIDQDHPAATPLAKVSRNFRGASGYFLLAMCLSVLPAFTNVKLASLQPEDFALLGLLGYSVLAFLYSGLIVRAPSQMMRLGKLYGLFLLTLCILSISSLRLQFYPLTAVSALKQPVIFSLSKLLQLIAVIGSFIWLTRAFLRDTRIIRYSMNLYWSTGVIASVYAVACYAYLAVSHSLRFADFSLFGAYANENGVLRARGFFNEGGPFGTYLVGVLIVGLLINLATGKRRSRRSTLVVITAFVLASSKAGFCVAALLLGYMVFTVASFRKRLIYCLIASSALVGMSAALNFNAQFAGYLASFQDIDKEMATRGEDLNLVVGRVAALYIVPRMIEAHPLAGIGFGNYPLMRNDPHYLGALPAMPSVEDMPALGFLGIAAEVGIPCAIWLLLLLCAPYWFARRKGRTIACAALFQPLAHAFAVQLTFFYPWFVSACALALATRTLRLEGSIQVHSADAGPK